MKKAFLKIDWSIYLTLSVPMVLFVLVANIAVLRAIGIGSDFYIGTGFVKAFIFPVSFLILIYLFNLTQAYVKNTILLVVIIIILLYLLLVYFDQRILTIYYNYVLAANTGNPHVDLYKEYNQKYFGTNAVIVRMASRYSFLALSLFAYQFWFLKHQTDKIERDRKIFEHAALESEMSRLRAQVNPHFLFNSINTIISESRNHKLVEELGRELSNVLRYNLSHTTSTALFSDEVDVTTSYLKVSKARFEDNLEINIIVSNEARAVKAPQPLLLPLIENALKYSFLTTKGPILISTEAFLKEGYLIASVENTGAWVEPLVPSKPGRQLGLSNLKARLELLYKDRANVSVDKFAKSVRVTVTVPISA